MGESSHNRLFQISGCDKGTVQRLKYLSPITEWVCIPGVYGTNGVRRLGLRI